MSKDIKNNELEDEQDEIITLMNEDGAEEEFLHVATIDLVEGKDTRWFIMLQPLDLSKFDDMKQDEVILFEIVQTADGEEDFVPVQDEAVMDKVYAEYLKMEEEVE